MCPYGAVFDKELLAGGNKQVVHYSAATGLVKGGRRDSNAGLPPSKWKFRLDPLHSHFIMVDDGTPESRGGERKVRGLMERYLCENDMSGDGIQTPMVLLLINGDADSIQWVIEA